MSSEAKKSFSVQKLAYWSWLATIMTHITYWFSLLIHIMVISCNCSWKKESIRVYIDYFFECFPPNDKETYHGYCYWKKPLLNHFSLSVSQRIAIILRMTQSSTSNPSNEKKRKDETDDVHINQIPKKKKTKTCVEQAIDILNFHSI